MKRDRTSRIVLILEIALIVLLHASKSNSNEQAQQVPTTNPNASTIQVMATSLLK